MNNQMSITEFMSNTNHSLTTQKRNDLLIMAYDLISDLAHSDMYLSDLPSIASNDHFIYYNHAIDFLNSLDVCFAKISPCFENGKAFIADGLENGIGAGTTELIVLRNREIDSKYAFYFVSDLNFVRKGCATYSGTVGQQRISMDFVKAYPFPSSTNTRRTTAHRKTHRNNVRKTRPGSGKSPISTRQF